MSEGKGVAEVACSAKTPVPAYVVTTHRYCLPTAAAVLYCTLSLEPAAAETATLLHADVVVAFISRAKSRSVPAGPVSLPVMPLLPAYATGK